MKKLTKIIGFIYLSLTVSLTCNAQEVCYHTKDNLSQLLKYPVDTVGTSTYKITQIDSLHYLLMIEDSDSLYIKCFNMLYLNFKQTEIASIDPNTGLIHYDPILIYEFEKTQAIILQASLWRNLLHLFGNPSKNVNAGNASNELSD